MHRQDQDLAELLRYENIAWYEDGTVRLMDRRVYPYEKKTVICNRHEEVAQAIADMVTQSGGPFLAVQMGMALASHEAKDLPAEDRMEYLRQAAHRLANARPTTAEKLRVMTDRSLNAAWIAWKMAGTSPPPSARMRWKHSTGAMLMSVSWRSIWCGSSRIRVSS